jgi:hypothetical protein
MYLFIARSDAAVAARFVDDLVARARWLASVGIIYFRINNDTVTVLRIVHGARDQSRVTLGDP